MAIILLVGELACPVCGETHRVTPQTALVRDARLGARELRAGDPIELSPAFMRDYTIVQPHTGDPLRVLEEGRPCEGERLWTEVTVERGRIAGLRLVRCDVALLDQLHAIGGTSSGFFDWARTLPDPSDWNDALHSSDRVRRLRLQLMLREPLPARNAHEAALFVEWLGCHAEGAPAQVTGTPLWHLHCAETELLFELANPFLEADAFPLQGGPSKILPADVFRDQADALLATVPDAPASHDARRALRRAIIYLENLLAFADAGSVPLAAFWTDRARADREARPDRYTRAAIDAELAQRRVEFWRLAG